MLCNTANLSSIIAEYISGSCLKLSLPRPTRTIFKNSKKKKINELCAQISVEHFFFYNFEALFRAIGKMYFIQKIIPMDSCDFFLSFRQFSNSSEKKVSPFKAISKRSHILATTQQPKHHLSKHSVQKYGRSSYK